MNLNIKTWPSQPSQMYFFTFIYAYSLSNIKPFKSFPVSTTRNITSLTSISTLFLKQDSTDPCSRPKIITYTLFFIFKTTTHPWQNFPFTPDYSCICLKSLWCGSLSINTSEHPTNSQHWLCPYQLLYRTLLSHAFHDLPLQKLYHRYLVII